MQTPDFSKYEAMRDAGSSREEVSRCAAADGLRGLEIAQVLVCVFQCSLLEAKEVWVRAEGIAESLNDYQEYIVLPMVREALEELEREPPEQ